MLGKKRAKEWRARKEVNRINNKQKLNYVLLAYNKK